jgi:23S rRNA (uracil1939-C5)-methyltransferase
LNVDLRITGVNLDGDGTAVHEGRTLAVPRTIPGERVEARLAAGRGAAAAAEVVRIIEASPHRVAPRCRHFGACGGCTWQHIEYGEQLRLKHGLVRELLDRGPAAGPRRTVLPAKATPGAGGGAPWGYRGKVHFVFGPGRRGQSLVMGHYRRASRMVVPVEECPVHAEAGNAFAFMLRDGLQRARIPGATADGSEGVARHVVVRVSEGTSQILATLVVTENVKPLRRVTANVEQAVSAAAAGGAQPRVGFHLNVHDRPGALLFGRETRRLFGLAEVREQVAGASYLVSPTAFFQTNVRAAGVLVDDVIEALAGEPSLRVLDLYSGVGLFAIPLALRGHTVTAVEENRQAVQSAAAAMRLNRVAGQGCRAIAARVEDAMPRLIGTVWDAVILDPPREGCPPDVLHAVFHTLRPRRIVYVSCNPEALARDLAAIAGTPYRTARIQPIDMFPHTPHVETVVVMNR